MVTTGSNTAQASALLSNANQTISGSLPHRDPTASIYQGSTDRYTQSAQAYTVQQFTSGTTAGVGNLGSGNLGWEFERTADLGGQTFLLMLLPGLANVVNLTDVSASTPVSGGAICEIVHPDIFDHYRLALLKASGADGGRVISETDPSFQWVAHDGSGPTDAGASFVHFYEGQPYWTPNCGYFAQNGASASIGGASIDTQHGVRAAAWSECNAQPGKRLGAMVGGSDLGSIRLNKHLEFKRRSMRFQLLCVPLLFSYCNSTESYLPLPAMQFHKVDLAFSMRHASELICNASQMPSGFTNAMGKISVVEAVLDGSTSSVTTHAAPFEVDQSLNASSATVYTVARYGEDTSTNFQTKKGPMVALVDDASWALTTALLGNTTTQVTNAKCPVLIGARMAFLQGEERASMIQGGYDIPMVISQATSASVTPSSGSQASLDVDISSFVNSIEALYVVTQSSNALGANHYNAGRTWDPLTEEYTVLAPQMQVTINGNDAYVKTHPAFYNKMLTYINATCVPTGDSHVYFAPFSNTTNSTDGTVAITGSAQAASRWSNAKVTMYFPTLLKTTAASAFAGATTDKAQKVIVYGDTYNSLHVGQGVGGNVMSSTQVSTAGFL